MSKEVIQNAVQQILNSYQRCGLKWFGRGPQDRIAPEVLEALVHLGSKHDVSDELGAFSGEPESASTSLNPIAPGLNPLAPARRPVDASLPPSTKVVTAVSSDGKSIVLRPEAGHADPWPESNLDDTSRSRVLEALAERVASCRLCSELCDYRQRTVFGDGPVRPAVCFMGEAPGADEDRTGLPFVGAAGQLLTRIIEATQLRREEVFILNALKCRPPNNRTPTDSEIANCRPYLMAQLEALQPQFIVCLGAVAVRSLLDCTTSIGRLRGKIYQFRGARVIVTYHPSYLLRQQQAKRLVWEDMQMLMRELGIPVTKTK